MTNPPLPQTYPAIVTTQPGPPTPQTLTLNSDLPLNPPPPNSDKILIRIRAFGLNRSELFTRQGHSPSVVFPRVLGIEGVGVVAALPDSVEKGWNGLKVGNVVATAMGGLGRAFDGSYAEYALVPVGQVMKLDLDVSVLDNVDGEGEGKLDWGMLGALPEMVQTSWGSLVTGLGLKEEGKGNEKVRLLIRGGTTSIGLMSAVLAKKVLGLGEVVCSSRRAGEREVEMLLRRFGADEVLDDADTTRNSSGDDGGSDGLAGRLEREEDKFDRVLELIGTKTLSDSLRCCRLGGVVCMTGIVAGSWFLEGSDRNPMELIPNGVRLTSYGGSERDFMATPLQRIVELVAKGEMDVPVGRVLRGLDKVVEAHELMDGNRGGGKVVVVL